MWIALTADHLLEALGAAELTALRTLQTVSGQKDPVPEVLVRTCGEVHGYIATRYPVGQPGTIPEELLSAAIAIGRWRLIGRLPVKILATDNRRQEYEDGIALLKDVAAGKFSLSPADNPSGEQPGPQGGGAWGGRKDF